MQMTKNQKNNLLEFLNRTSLVGKEAVTLVNLQYSVANAKEVSEEDEMDSELNKKNPNKEK